MAKKTKAVALESDEAIEAPVIGWLLARGARECGRSS
jgi:hypothetical protein